MKSLKEICLNFIRKKCNSKIDIRKNWLNYGMGCIPFKLYYNLLADEFYYCSCKLRLYKITFLQRKREYTKLVRAENCFHCWFLFMLEIKIKIFFKNRDKIIHFASLLSDFFAFINKFKYIYVSPDFSNVEIDMSYDSFHYHLNETDPCLCYHLSYGPF